MFDTNDTFKNYTPVLNIGGEEIYLNILFFNNEYTNIIPLESFISLDIEENINSPFYKGVLTIRNEHNIFDTAKEYVQPDTNILKYDFLENGENYIYIKIISNDSTKEYAFNIIKEYESIEKNTKAKNFVLVDIQLWYMMNSKTSFSTISLLEKDPSQLSNKDRMVDTGTAIKSLIKNSVNSFSINEENWSPSSSKIFHSSNHEDTILETLNKILENTLDIDGDNMLLLKRNNKFNLFSIKQMYKDFFKNNYAKYNFGGRFSLNSDGAVPETPLTYNSIRINEYSIYNENSKNTLNSIINYKVFNYNNKDKKFNIYNEKNTTESTFDYLEKNYLGDKTLLNRGTNNNIKKNRYYKTFYSVSDDDKVVESEGKQDIIKNLLNYSTALNMVSPGLFNLDTGNFIVVNNDISMFNKNLRKLDGGWFVTGFKHSLTSDKFITEISSTKIYDLKKDE